MAGTITGSVALLTEAMHSAIDLIASIVAFISVRKADEPADAEHPYGHEKIENLAAMIEGILILVGSGVIAFEAIRHLIVGSQVSHLGFGIAVVGGLDRRELLRVAAPAPPRARDASPSRSRPTPRTCAPTWRRRSACWSGSRS